MVPDPTYDEYAYRIGDENRTKQLDQVAQTGGTGREGRLRTNRFDTGAKRGASANIVETPDGDVVVVDSDFNEAKMEHEIDARLGENDSLYMVSTHAHRDHTSNNQAILDDYDVETHYAPPKHRADKHLSEDDLDIHQANDTDLVEVASGDEISIGGTAFEIDHPPRESVEETTLNADTNENSLGVTVGYADSANPDLAVADYTARFNGDKLAAGQQSELDQHTETFEQRAIDDTERPHHGDAKAADPAYRAAEGAKHEYINAPLYDKSYSHPNIESFDVYDGEDVDVYWSGLHGDFHHDGEGSPTVERGFSTDPQDLKTVRQRVEGMKAEAAENAEKYDSRFDERSDQFNPKTDDPVEELRTVLDNEMFEQIYNTEQVAEVDAGEMNQQATDDGTNNATDQATEQTAPQTKAKLFDAVEAYADANDTSMGDVIQSLRQTAIGKGVANSSAKQNGTAGEEGKNILEGIRSASIEDEEKLSTGEDLNNRPDDDDDDPSLSR